MEHVLRVASGAAGEHRLAFVVDRDPAVPEEDLRDALVSARLVHVSAGAKPEQDDLHDDRGEHDAACDAEDAQRAVHACSFFGARATSAISSRTPPSMASLFDVAASRYTFLPVKRTRPRFAAIM